MKRIRNILIISCLLGCWVYVGGCRDEGDQPVMMPSAFEPGRDPIAVKPARSLDVETARLITQNREAVLRGESYYGKFDPTQIAAAPVEPAPAAPVASEEPRPGAPGPARPAPRAPATGAAGMGFDPNFF